MPFAQDRDLATLDPIIFRDVLWTGQTLTRGEGLITGTVLTTVGSPEVPFTQTTITEGHIVNIGGFILEVEAVVSAGSLSVSVLRPTTTTPAEQPRQTDTLPFTIVTFRPQIAWVHRQLLHALGLRALGEPGDGPAESAVTNPADLARVEALGALALIYSAAGALEAADSPNNQRAAQYRRRFTDERARTTAHLDTDGDALPDSSRRFTTYPLTRL